MDGQTIFYKGAFSEDGNLPQVASNALLVKGLFADSIPQLLSQQRAWAQQYSEVRQFFQDSFQMMAPAKACCQM